MDNQQGKVTVTDLAWLAGFVDGEGTITLSDRRYLNKRISPHFILTNTHFASLDHALDIIGRAGINAHVLQKAEPKKAGNYRPAGTIELAGFERVRKLLVLLQPYLVTKERQTAIVLEFIARRQAQPRFEPVTIEDLEALREIRKLNKRNWTTLTDYTRDSELEARECRHCGQAFQPVQVSQVYCSVKCRQNKYVTLGPPRACPKCGVVFEPRNRPQQVYCSSRCRMIAGQARYRARQITDGIVEPMRKLTG